MPHCPVGHSGPIGAVCGGCCGERAAHTHGGGHQNARRVNALTECADHGGRSRLRRTAAVPARPVLAAAPARPGPAAPGRLEGCELRTRKRSAVARQWLMAAARQPAGHAASWPRWLMAADSRLEPASLPQNQSPPRGSPASLPFYPSVLRLGVCVRAARRRLSNPPGTGRRAMDGATGCNVGPGQETKERERERERDRVGKGPCCCRGATWSGFSEGVLFGRRYG